MQMQIEMISAAAEIVITTTTIVVRDELLSFPAKAGTLPSLKQSECWISEWILLEDAEERGKNLKSKNDLI